MMRASLSDQQLISLYLSGDEAAFETLLNRHQQQVYSKIFFIVRDNDLANDLFQDTFIKVVNTLKAGSYNEEGKFLPWAMRIAHNLVIDHFRKSNKVRMISESSSQRDDFNIFHTLKLEDENVQDEMTRVELESQMVDLIDHLPDTQ